MVNARVLGVGGVKMVEGDDEVRAGKCLVEIKETLMRYDCALMPVLTLRPATWTETSCLCRSREPEAKTRVRRN